VGPKNAYVETHIYVRTNHRGSACGVYNTFESSTSKYLLKTLRSKSVRVFTGKLHAWYVKVRAPTVIDGPHDDSTWVGTLAAMLLRLCTPRRKILCGCYTKIVWHRNRMSSHQTYFHSREGLLQWGSLN